MKSLHDRKFVPSLIGLVRGTVRYGLDVLGEVRDEVELMMIREKFLEGAPFLWVGLSIRYGLKTDTEPIFQGIHKKYGELAMAIEVDSHDIMRVKREQVYKVFFEASMRALIGAGKKYSLPIAAFEQALAKSEQQGASESPQ